MTLKLIVEKLARGTKKFVTDDELKADCRLVSVNYLTAVKYLIRHKYVARIFKGIFYVYSMNERKHGALEMEFYMIIAEALRLKGVKKWYFGLETGLKFNNLTHESFTIDFVINDSLFRPKPMVIMGRKVRFYKLVPKMFSFGIVKKSVYYSDSEKTALDLLHLKHYNIAEFEEISEKMSRQKLIKYAKKYPFSLQRRLQTR